MDTHSLKRSELYKKIWETPMTRLAKEFGISDVALAKTCKKYDIPRPPRGYWARIANGYDDPKTRLPKAEDVQIEFDVEKNRRNREWHQKQKEAEVKRNEAVKPAIEMAENIAHPLATRFLERIGNVKPDENGLVKMKRVGLPEVEISENAISRVGRFLSIIAYALEEKKVSFGRTTDGGGLLFKRDGFGVSIKISQALKKKEREPTLEDKRKPSWEWNLTYYCPTEKLSLTLHSDKHFWGRKKWSETNATDIVGLSAKVSGRIDELLREFEDKRLVEIEREKQREAQRVIDEKNRRIEERLKHIDQIKANRARELVRAAMLWQEHRVVTEFINECARRWGDTYSSEQLEWLKWANEILDELSPFADGYPSPELHGPFDESTVEEKDFYYYDEQVFVQKTQLLKDIKKLTDKRGYAYSSW